MEAALRRESAAISFTYPRRVGQTPASYRLRSIDTLGHQHARVKDGGEKVLRWLCYDSVTLKKFAMTVKRLPTGEVGSGPIDFEARAPMPDETFLPAQLVR